MTGIEIGSYGTSDKRRNNPIQELYPALRFLRRIYPFTLFGSLAVAASLVLTLRGYSYASSHELLLGLIGITALAATAAAVRMERRRRETAGLEFLTVAHLQAGSTETLVELTSDGRATPVFLRLCVDLRGRLILGGGAELPIRGEVDGTGESNLLLDLHLPCGGILRTELGAHVRDCFGLCSVEIEGDVHRTAVVNAPHFPMTQEYYPDRLAGEENRRTVNSAEEERYLMREYAPGDRVRDINWKASSRLQTLLTRVSPEAQEESIVLPVVFQHGITDGAQTPYSIAERNYRLAWLRYFLESVLGAGAAVQIDLLICGKPELRTAMRYFHVETVDDLREQKPLITRAALLGTGSETPADGGIEGSGFDPETVAGLCVFARADDPSYRALQRRRRGIVTRHFVTRSAADSDGGSERPSVVVKLLAGANIGVPFEKWVLRARLESLRHMMSRTGDVRLPTAETQVETAYIEALL